METRLAKRKKISHIDHHHQVVQESTGVDRISDLPDAVLHQILFLLPIKFVAQTSVLSKRWKTLWTTFPDLDFTTFNVSSKTHNPSSNDVRKQRLGLDFVTQILRLRNKHNDIRSLRFRASLSFSRLNTLIRLAVRSGVQELDVDFATDDYFNFPRCVIGSESLRVLNMKSSYPGFRLPPSCIMREGFKFLKTLSLSLIILHNQPYLSDLFSDSAFPLLKKLSLDTCSGLTHLHVGCRALEDLNLENCFQLQGLDISGPKLDKLRVACCFDTFTDNGSMKICAPKLRVLVWEYNAVTTVTDFGYYSSSLQDVFVDFFVSRDVSTVKLQSMSNFLRGLSHVRCLTLESQCVEIISNNSYFAVYLQPFHKLKSLELRTGFNKKNILGLACLFKSCPTLHTLILKIINDCKIERKLLDRDLWDMASTEEEQYWESQTRALESFLRHLKVVKIHGFLECENEVTLAKFLLKHGKALEQMILCTENYSTRNSLRRQKIRSQMMGFCWASSNAKVAFF